jgi:dihydrofolate reductase
MRRIVMFNHVSADGYFAAPDGNLNWVVPDDDVAKAGVARIPECDTMLFGRRTYQMFEAYWPHAVDGSGTAADPHNPERRSTTIHDMALWINAARKIVVSTTLTGVSWQNAELRPTLDVGAVEALKREPGKDVMVFGSGSVVSQLTQHGLIDEYQFIVSPTLLGRGRTLLDGVTRSAPLALVESRQFDSGCMMLRYAHTP